MLDIWPSQGAQLCHQCGELDVNQIGKVTTLLELDLIKALRINNIDGKFTYKKEDLAWICVNPNKSEIMDCHSLPLMEDLSTKLAGATHYSQNDLT